MNQMNHFHGVPVNQKEKPEHERDLSASFTLIACAFMLALIYWTGKALVSFETYVADYIPETESLYASF